MVDGKRVGLRIVMKVTNRADNMCCRSLQVDMDYPVGVCVFCANFCNGGKRWRSGRKNELELPATRSHEKEAKYLGVRTAKVDVIPKALLGRGYGSPAS